MKKLFVFTLFTLFIIPGLTAQNQKKKLDHDAIEKWNNITQTVISDNGSYIAYKLEPWRGDSKVYIYSSKGERLNSFDCAANISFTADSRYLVFKRTLALEIQRELKQKKTKKGDMPGDKLGVYNINDSELMEFENIVSYKTPSDWSGYMAYQVEASPEKEKEKTDNEPAEEKKDKAKKESAKNGYKLNLLNTDSGETISWPFVKTFIFGEDKKELVFVSTGDDKDFSAGLYKYNLGSGRLLTVLKNKGEFKNITLIKDGSLGAFILKENLKSEDIEVYIWKADNNAELVLSNDKEGIKDGWALSANGGLQFSNNGARLFFGTAAILPEKDTMRIDDEYPDVDIWHGSEGVMHTVQVLNKERDIKKAYKASFDISSGDITQLESSEIPNVRLINRGDCDYVLGLSNVPYQLQSMWEGSPNHYDVYLINVNNGSKLLIKKDIRARVESSPGGKYLTWYNYMDASYYSYNIGTKKENRLTSPESLVVANELNDIPNPAGPYQPTGWLEDDMGLLVNDRYDIWKLDLEGKTDPVNMTVNGRETNTTYRYISFDREELFISTEETLLLSAMNDITRNSYYYSWKADKASAPKEIIGGAYALSNLRKAKDAKTVVYSKSTFVQFPDLLVSDMKFKKSLKISDANPQQTDYNWGSAELIKWISLDGMELEGMLFKPADFDPNKLYPMLVNFYEKSSQGLFDHRTPELHRSTIDYHYYTSNGYIIFNPDVYYEDGYPGESAFNCVMPGVTAIINMGFVDKDRIGAQGHSWGGYQVAYLATRTDLFAAIESGAPVVNMFSAYGGIRWWSGLNRSFQYEHTQSRIGATIWEAPLRYLENSPLFTMDKVTTPILIMHNDSDGHVPWYQGIEYFVALRRLQKPVWMLNYTGEPHWPQKLKNKKDFQIRMSQFFDHYLKGEAMPVWMKEGIPAINKKYELGYER